MPYKAKIFNLDDFRQASSPQIIKQNQADSNFTAEERKALEAAFEFGKTIGAFKEARMDSNRKMSLFHITIADNKKTTLNVSKHNVLGEFKYALDTEQQGSLKPCGNFEDAVKAIYDYASSIAPEKEANPTLKV